MDSVTASVPEEASDVPSPGFDLGRDPGMVLQLLLLFGAGLYVLVDTFFLLQYTPLTSMPLAPFALALIVALPLALWLGRRAPGTERLAVAVLTAEPHLVEYVPTAPGRFRSATGEYPALDLSDRSLAEYWAQREPGAGHPFTLLRGNADFWQLDLAPLYERTRGFYATRDP